MNKETEAALVFCGNDYHATGVRQLEALRSTA